MTASCFVTTFAKDASNTDGAIDDIAIPFTPKACIVFSHGSDGTASEAHYYWSVGFSDGTNHCCSAMTSDDADAESDTAVSYSNEYVYVGMSETLNSVVGVTATVAFSSNNIRFTWVENSAVATRFSLIAFGGDDTSAKVNTVTINRDGAGTQDYTGLGFNPTEPNAVLFALTANSTTAVFEPTIDGARSSFGCASSTTKRWAVCNTMENAADPSDTFRVTATDKCIHCLNHTDGTTLAASADFSGWITDGFTLNWTTNPGTTVLFSYLVIKGATWDVGTLTAPTTATNDVDYAVSVNSNTLRGLLLAGCGDTVSGTIGDNASISMGAADGTPTQANITTIDEDAQATTDSYRAALTTNIARLLNGVGTNTDLGVFDSFSTNNFRIDWTTKSASAQLYGWVVIADESVVPPPDDEANGQMNFIVENNVGAARFG